MAVFTPNSIIHIGKVKFDNTYTHTMHFSTLAQQLAYFEGVCDTRFDDTHYTYLRPRNAIRVEANAEQLYNFNYVMFQNANFGTKWFYSFIVECNYINERTTELVLETDVMQTWYFDYSLCECFVEREHVYNDKIGSHIMPEPVPTGLTAVIGSSECEDLKGLSIIVESTAYPEDQYWIGSDHGQLPFGIVQAQTVVGAVYNNVYSGSCYFVFGTDYAGYSSAQAFLSQLARAGAAQAVTGIYMFPTAFIPGTETVGIGGEWTMIAKGMQPSEKEYIVAKPYAALDNGYVPRNNKLYTYPYNFLRVTDYVGRDSDYRYEYFYNSGNASFHVYAPMLSTGVPVLVPENYNGVADNMADSTTAQAWPLCPWSYSGYQNWLGQHGVQLAISGLQGALAIAGPEGMGAAMAMQPVKNEATTAAGKAANTVIGGVATGANTASSIGDSGLPDLMGSMASHATDPSHSHGSLSGGNLAALGHNTFGFYQMSIRQEFLSIADSFMDYYGYEVDTVKVPYTDSRPYWNYVKTKRAGFNGDVPSSDMGTINKIYDKGITFWHDSNVGDYSRNNQAPIRS